MVGAVAIFYCKLIPKNIHNSWIYTKVSNDSWEAMKNTELQLARYCDCLCMFYIFNQILNMKSVIELVKTNHGYSIIENGL